MGAELAGRQLRSAAYRVTAVAEVVSGVLDGDAATDVVTLRNERRRVGKFFDTHHRTPVDLFELAPDAPRVPEQVPLAAGDRRLVRTHQEGARVTWEVLLPTCPTPRRGDWSWTSFSVTLPDRYVPGQVKAPTLRVVDGAVRVDVPVEMPKVVRTGVPGRVLGLDWGVRHLLTGAVANAAGGQVFADGRPLFFDAGPLIAKTHRLRTHRENARTKADHLDRLLTGHPDPHLRARRDVLLAEADRLDTKQGHLSTQVARLGARWAVDQAVAASASVLAVEDLRTLEHRDRGARTNVRVSMGLRGQVRTELERAATDAGVRVVDVRAAGTSTYCPMCPTRLVHTAAPTGGRGYGWATCPGCGFTADRDHAGGVNIAARGAAIVTGLPVKGLRVRKRRTARRDLTSAGRSNAPARRPRLRGPKSSPTPRRGTSSHASRASTPPAVPRLGVGQRRVGPHTQDHKGVDQWREQRRSYPFEGAAWAHRFGLQATPVLYAPGQPRSETARPRRNA